MKNNSNSVNVNLNRVMVIDRLKSKLTAVKAEFAHAKQIEDRYESDKRAYQATVINATVEALKNGAAVKDVDSYSDETVIRVLVNTKHITQPKNPRYELKTSSDRIQQDIDAIESNINLLEMCSDETIKSKSYGNKIGRAHV